MITVHTVRYENKTTLNDFTEMQIRIIEDTITKNRTNTMINAQVETEPNIANATEKTILSKIYIDIFVLEIDFLLSDTNYFS